VIFFLVRAADAVELELIRTHPTGTNESWDVRWTMGGRLSHIWGVVGAPDSMVIGWLPPNLLSGLGLKTCLPILMESHDVPLAERV
jgi:hypothetical protein